MTAPAPDAFVHPALFYGCDDEYLAVLVPFVTEGLALGHPVAVAVPGARLRLLREALGGAAQDVLLLDMEQAGRNPGRIIPTVLRRFADEHQGVHVRIVGEPIWAGRSATEYPACAQHEALINLAFAGRDVTIVCPYDTASLDAAALEDALVTHPVVWRTDRRHPSGRYAPLTVVNRYNQPLPAAEGAPEVHVGSSAQIRDARRFTTAQAGRLDLGAERTAELELIATELVTNSLRHSGGGCRLRVWTADGHLVCEVRDEGRLADPLAGRHPARPGQFGGRGLLLVNQLADLVRTHTSPEGTTVYALLRLDRPPLS
ncbi:sensor histidine kinase [Actinosynnema sp. NPDC050436]|uniref:sensor histidine kinase n=1 Tax=Actinosynnema sp. NPDC050436 TaxID=3155659 RepID=UPI0033C3F511